MSEEDGIFCGTINGINDLVTFEADNFKDLKAAFEEAVDDYLVFCEECGKVPEKTYRGQFNVRISPKLHRDLAIESFKQNISLNQIVEQACNDYVKHLKCNCDLTNLIEEHYTSLIVKTIKSDFGWKASTRNSFNANFAYGGIQ